jgi:hypothetical protein
MRAPQRHYRGRSYRGHGRALTAGQEAARRHIEEAREFEREMGGTVSDVKRYFFGLSTTQLDEIFSAYGRSYNSSAEAYARQIFPKWKSGVTKMSGLVAKRLFDFLPPKMPIAVKLELAGNIWNHFGASSRHHFTVGPTADLNSVMDSVRAKLESVIQDYDVPQNVKDRFDWLAAGDVQVKERLLNHFRQMDRKIATDSLNEQLPILQAQMRDPSTYTKSIRTKIKIHKHSVEICIDPRLKASFREGPPDPTSPASGAAWFIAFVVIIVVITFVIILSAHH